MDRLTNHFDYCKMIDCKYYDAELFKHGKCKFFDNSIEHCHEKRMNDKLREYEDLEEQGMLLRIPVRIGERVYVFSKEWNRAYPITVASIVICKNCLFIRNGRGESFCFGTEAFLTFSEAEAALKEMNSNKGE